MGILKKSLVASLVLMNFSTFARTILATIVSDTDSELTVMSYDLDKDERSITHLYKETYSKDKKTLIQTVELKESDLLGTGIAMAKKDKYVAVRIWSNNFDRERGGVLFLDTLYNGATGERREYQLDLVKTKNGYSMLNNKKEFSQMKFLSKKIPFVGVVGISNIQFVK